MGLMGSRSQVPSLSTEELVSYCVGAGSHWNNWNGVRVKVRLYKLEIPLCCKNGGKTEGGNKTIWIDTIF